MYYIYQITCLANGTYYIGRSKNPSKRWYKHRLLLNRGEHNRVLQNAWNKYGEKCFIWEVISSFTSLIESQNEEQRLLNEFVCKLNVNRQASGVILCGPDNGFYGKKHTKETLELISISRKGKGNGPRSVQWKENISKSLLGKKITDEKKSRISTTLTGVSFTEERRSAWASRSAELAKIKAKWFVWLSPLGEKIEAPIYFLEETYGLKNSMLKALTYGAKPSYKQWRCLSCLISR